MRRVRNRAGREKRRHHALLEPGLDADIEKHSSPDRIVPGSTNAPVDRVVREPKTSELP
jgi:hypothetical protein